MKNQKTILTAISTFAMAFGVSANAAQPGHSGGSFEGFTQSCQQERRAAINSCRTEYENAMQRLFKDPSADQGEVFKIESTIRSLCEKEAEREYDYCTISAHFQGTNIVDAFADGEPTTEQLIRLTPVEPNDNISPLLSGSNYRTIAQLCDQMPAYGGALHSWTGLEFYTSCLRSTWEACMNDPEMGSNAAGSGSNPYAPDQSERLENCGAAISTYDIPVI